MAWRVVTPPAESPVSLSEAKAHLRLEESVDDAYITTLIDSARVYVEKACDRGLVLQTVELLGPPLCGDEELSLPGGALADTPQLQVQYLDANSVLQTLDAAKYYTVSGGDSRPADLHLIYPNLWPQMAPRFDAVKVQYRVGWANAAAVPAPLRHAVLLLLSELYEYRTPEVTGTIVTKLGFSLDALMAPFRFRSL